MNGMFGSAISGNPSLTAIQLPSLAEVSGSFVVGACPELVGLSFPRLQRVGRNFVVGYYTFGYGGGANAKLQSLECPVLTEVGELAVTLNSALETLSLPSFVKVTRGYFYVSSNAHLRQCVVDAVLAQCVVAPANVQTFGNGGMPNVCP